MKIIGLIGGMSWESTLEYYRIINQTVKEKLGGFHSGKIMMYSVDFHEIEKLQHLGDWEAATNFMCDAAQRLEKAGADFVVICTNTMHLMAEEVQKSIQIPLLHIVDVTAAAIKAHTHKKVGLLGTKFTMEQDFYKARLKDKHQIEVVIPNEQDRQRVHDILYNELCLGEIKDLSRGVFHQIIEDLIKQGAEGIILGCTEIPLIINQREFEIPLYDTTEIHARAAVEYALKNNS